MRDQFWPNTTLLLQGNGTNGAQNNTFLDSSTNNFTITRNGNTTQGSFTPYEANGYWSNFFDGSGDYLTVANNTAFVFGSGDFTVEIWAYVTSTADQTFYARTNTSGIGTGISIALSGKWYGVVSTDGVNPISITSSASAVPHSWNHVALTRSGTTLTMWVNGVSAGTNTVSGSLNDPATTIYLGAAFTGSIVNAMSGYMSNVRVVKGTAVYTAAFTPPTAPLTAVSGTSLLTCQSNRFIDNSTNAFAITRNGDTSVQAFQPFPGATTWSGSVLGGSGYFDGSGDYLSVADSAPLELGSGNWTIECWVYTSNSTAYSALITRDDGATTAGSYVILLNGASANGLISFWAADVNSFSAAVLQGTVKCNDSAWHHIAIVRNGNTLTLYIDGTSNSTASYSGAFANTAQPILIGAETGYPREYTGYISNVRYVIGTAVYTANFTPPTAPLTAVTNTQLLLNFTNAGIFDSAMMNNLETVGNAQVSTSVVKYGTGSMAFDGTGDYLLISQSNPGLLLGTAPFTIEFWFNTASSTRYAQFIGNEVSGGSSELGFTILINNASSTSGDIAIYRGTTGLINSASGNYRDNVWHHFALARDSSGSRIYIDGIQQGSTNASQASTTFDSANGFRWAIGANLAVSGRDYLGYIDDLRITKGAARYIGNFTPPVARMPGQ
jgi:hypothetical protein